MNILTRKENILKNNITTSAINIEVRDSFLINTLTIFITILLEDLKKINYWTIPAIYLKEHTKDYKLTCKYVELEKMEILEVPKSDELVKVARLKYTGDFERKPLCIDEIIVDRIVYDSSTTMSLGSHYM